MTSLNYSHKIIADVECQNVTAHPAMGHYRLVFTMKFDLKKWNGDYLPSLTDLRLVVKLKHGVVGTALPQEESFLPTVSPNASNSIAVQRSFAVDVDRYILDNIEKARREGDIPLELEVLGTGTIHYLRDAAPQDKMPFSPVVGIEPLLFEPFLTKANVHYRLPQSEWIELLDRMEYARVLLYEIPWPKSDDDKLSEAISYFESARESFLSGSYTDAVAKLRKSLESAWSTISCEKLVWSNKVKNSESRGKMTLPERFLLTWNSIHHLTHPAAHRSGNYSRDEAHYILGMGGLALSLAANASGMLEEARKEAGQQQ